MLPEASELPGAAVEVRLESAMVPMSVSVAENVPPLVCTSPILMALPACKTIEPTAPERLREDVVMAPPV